ncbi:hypothetical protein ACFMPD_17090 [Sedimentitalea sp. HM32M-2]|uniref:hypothetical protein n=1 Tax=Sedimentitalea sp. HM32M-2 TaxID=3351566 RepID=UPI00363446C3
MPQPTKIATCCYCGTRAALILTGQVRHELSCATCGAPLHDLKMLRRDRLPPAQTGPATPMDLRSVRSALDGGHGKTGKTGKAGKRGGSGKKRGKPVRSKPKKHRKRGMTWLLKETIDVIEDLLD